MRDHYTATCERSGRYWAIRVEELPGVFSQSRRLSDVDEMARDAIAAFLDVAPTSFDVEVRRTLPPAVVHATQARQAAKDAERAAEQATKSAIVELRSQGLPVREVGELLGLSAARVAQIAPAQSVSRPTGKATAKSSGRKKAAA